MNLQEFKHSLTATNPPPGVSLALQSLWHDAKGDWETAHRCAQAQDDSVGAWVHAYLHRVEGDPANAAYWYRRANRPFSHRSLQEEWEEIATALLEG
jgi:hypothetical protein